MALNMRMIICTKILMIEKGTFSDVALLEKLLLSQGHMKVWAKEFKYNFVNRKLCRICMVSTHETGSCPGVD